MNKSELQNRMKKLHTGVAAMEAAGDIPTGSTKDVYLVLLEASLRGESFQSVFD